MAKRTRDYLSKRPNSQHWRVRFQMDGRSVEKSLRTPDRTVAELMALPLIAEHKAKLFEAARALSKDRGCRNTSPAGSTGSPMATE